MIHFCLDVTPSGLVRIQGADVDKYSVYKYFGVHISNHLTQYTGSIKEGAKLSPPAEKMKVLQSVQDTVKDILPPSHPHVWVPTASATYLSNLKLKKYQ